MKRVIRFAVIASVLFAGRFASAGYQMAAQSLPPYPAEKNPYFGAFYSRTTLRGDIQGIDIGNGAGFRIRFESEDRLTALEFAIFKTGHNAGPGERVSFVGQMLNLQLMIPINDIVSPYGSAGLGEYTLETSKTVYRDSWINGFQIGGGFNIKFAEHLMLNLGYTKIRTHFDTWSPGGYKVHLRGAMYDAGLNVQF